MDNAAQLYLDLMKKCLTNLIYCHAEHWPIPPDQTGDPEAFAALEAKGLTLMLRTPADLSLRMEGRDWPPTAHTMVGLKRLDNLQFCIENVLADNVPGDVIETGVWRGGSCIFMRAIFKVYGANDRTVWVADSFDGLPPVNADAYPADAADPHAPKAHQVRYLAVSMEDVQANFGKYGLLDSQVRFLKGWFRDTLPAAPMERLSVLRLDGDLYESTIQALESLYPKLSPGGYVIVDDYDVPVARQAVQDYRLAHGVHDEIIPIDWTGVYWRRSA